MRISDWSSDVCSSDLESRKPAPVPGPKPMPLFRRDFALGGPVAHAFLSIVGLGHHAVSINGREAHASMLDPGWTDYRQTVLRSEESRVGKGCVRPCKSWWSPYH